MAAMVTHGTAPPKKGRAAMLARTLRYKAAMQRACSAQELHDVMREIVKDAKGMGTEDSVLIAQARKLLLEYTLGRPRPMSDEHQQGTQTVAAILFGANQPRGA